LTAVVQHMKSSNYVLVPDIMHKVSKHFTKPLPSMHVMHAQTNMLEKMGFNFLTEAELSK